MSNIMCNECKRCDGDLCTYFDNYSDRESTIACILFEPKRPTVFDTITASPEVLAPYFVFATEDTVLSRHDERDILYFSSITGGYYQYPDNAIAATVAKLKEVAAE